MMAHLGIWDLTYWITRYFSTLLGGYRGSRRQRDLLSSAPGSPHCVHSIWKRLKRDARNVDGVSFRSNGKDWGNEVRSTSGMACTRDYRVISTISANEVYLKQLLVKFNLSYQQLKVLVYYFEPILLLWNCLNRNQDAYLRPTSTTSNYVGGT